MSDNAAFCVFMLVMVLAIGIIGACDYVKYRYRAEMATKGFCVYDAGTSNERFEPCPKAEKP